MAESKTTTSYWRKNVQILSALLMVWFIVSYGLGILLVEPLNEYHLGGFPLGFWFAQQGSIYVFVILILAYAILLSRLDKKYAKTSAVADADQSEPKQAGDDS
jgi:putative solute:sodium symporter small subunit